MPNWGEVLQDIQKEQLSKAQEAMAAQWSAQGAVDTIRRRYLRELHEHTGRNVIAALAEAPAPKKRSR